LAVSGVAPDAVHNDRGDDAGDGRAHHDALLAGGQRVGVENRSGIEMAATPRTAKNPRDTWSRFVRVATRGRLSAGILRVW